MKRALLLTAVLPTFAVAAMLFLLPYIHVDDQRHLEFIEWRDGSWHVPTVVFFFAAAALIIKLFDMHR